MAEDNKKPAANGGATAPQMQVRVLGQYIKDLSFESPNVAQILAKPPENPGINLELNVATEQVQPHVYEVALNFKAQTSATGVGTIYELELAYAGLIRVENAPPEVLEAVLNVNCPALLFPFMRRIAADLTREGGFPPLMLDPVDFGSLYMRKRQAAQSGAPAVKS